MFLTILAIITIVALIVLAARSLVDIACSNVDANSIMPFLCLILFLRILVRALSSGAVAAVGGSSVDSSGTTPPPAI